MSPWAVLWLLEQAGRLLERFRPSAGSAGWWDLFELDEYQADREEIEALLKGMNDAALEQAIAALSERQEQILAGRRRRELPTNETSEHLALGGLKQILEARRARIQLDPAFAIWLLEQALPALKRAAPFFPVDAQRRPQRSG